MSSATRRATVIAVGNQKGGTGKSTVSVHLAAALGLMGNRCLVIDLDPASGATRHLGVLADEFAGTLELLTTDEPFEGFVITKDMPRGVELIPSRPQLSDLDSRLSRFADRTRLLDRVMADARGGYDYIILDTAPTAASSTTLSAYGSADWFLLTAFPHPLSLAGLSEAFRDIGDVRRLRNPRLEILGVVLTNVDRRARRMQAEVQEALSDVVPGKQFRTVISQAAVVPEASGRGRTVFQLPKGDRLPSSQQFLDLAWEVVHRTTHRDAFTSGTLVPCFTPESVGQRHRMVA